MKVVQINTFPYKSTGTIMMNIHKCLQKNDVESYVAWGRGRKSENEYEIFMNDKIGVYWHGLYTRVTDKTGFASKRSTKRLLKKLDEIKPDIVHLHNIHGYYINIEMLFNYLKENKIKTVWTLHDCWAFTGHCAYFTCVNCNKWKDECHDCPQLNTYPISYNDNSKWNYDKKKDLFTGLNLTIVTPSQWLAELVKSSFLNDYDVEVINNGIDTEIFKPRKSDFRKKYGLEDKKIILGVASEWTERKGLKDFIELSKLIDKDEIIVLVGLNDKQIKNLPNNIIGIKRTENAIQLAEIYTAADVYFSPSIEETFGMTILESIACGTKSIVYKGTAMEELVNEDNGFCIDIGDLNFVSKTIKEVKKIKEDGRINDSKILSKIMATKYFELYKTKYNEENV